MESRSHNKFTFDDESQRIIRRTAHVQKPIGGNTLPEDDLTTYTYAVEHSDFSKEDYNESGRITNAYDKYGNVVLSYTYNTSGQLTSVTFRGSKIVTFGYASNCLNSITYNGKTTTFNYKSDGTLNYVQHYTGVKYTFTLSKPSYSAYDVNFECKASATENNATVSYSKNLTLVYESNNYAYKVNVIDKIGSNAVNTVTYRFPETIAWPEYKPPFKYVDIIDNNGVETRMQILDHKVMCSYEVQNGEPQFESDTNKFIGDVTLYNSESGSKNAQSTGVQTRNSGSVIIDHPENHYHCWQMDIGLSVVKKGCYTLSGWVRSSDVNHKSKTFFINNSGATVNGLDIYLEPNGIWQYFSLTTYIEANYIYAKVEQDSAEFKDVRFTCCGSLDTEDSTWHMRSTEYNLLYGNVEIPFEDARFYYTSGGTNTEIKGTDESDEKQVNFADALRYKLRKKRDGVSNEVYYNNCKDIVTGTTDLKVLHGGSYISISNFDLGVKNYFPGRTSLTRITVDDNNQSSNIVKVCKVTQKTGETTEVSTEKLNKYAENKPRVILILQYLMKNTDDLHTVTISDITEHLKSSGIEANRHTIMRDIQQLQECGFDIICQRSRMNQYSIGERILELPELKLLIDAVEAARFIPQPKSEALIEKLSSLASKYQAKHLSSNIYSNKRVKSDNSRVYYSIDLINQAISENKMIRFQYFSYLPTKEKALKFDGMFYRFSPHRITWSNDSYYVIGLNYKYNNEVVYRIDRMTSLEIMDEEAKPVEEGFDMDSFLKSNFLMFDGELTRVTLKCEKAMMNSIIDKFGEDVETSYDAEQDPDHFYAYADAATGPTFYSWVFNYQGKIRIVEPQNIRDEFIEMLQKQLT